MRLRGKAAFVGDLIQADLAARARLDQPASRGKALLQQPPPERYSSQWEQPMQMAQGNALTLRRFERAEVGIRETGSHISADAAETILHR
jgi:hypothetical protein